MGATLQYKVVLDLSGMIKVGLPSLSLSSPLLLRRRETGGNLSPMPRMPFNSMRTHCAVEAF